MNVSKMVKDRLKAETDAATRACIKAAEDEEESDSSDDSALGNKT